MRACTGTFGGPRPAELTHRETTQLRAELLGSITPEMVETFGHWAVTKTQIDAEHPTLGVEIYVPDEYAALAAMYHVRDEVARMEDAPEGIAHNIRIVNFSEQLQ